MTDTVMEGERALIRFSPFTPEGLERNIQEQVGVDKVKGVVPRWGFSAYVATRFKGESEAEMLERVCDEVPLRGKHVAVVPESVLEDYGLTALLDEPPPNHRLVGCGTLAELPDLEQVAVLLSGARKPNPNWKRS